MDNRFFPNAIIVKESKSNKIYNLSKRRNARWGEANYNPYARGTYYVSNPIFTNDYKFAFVWILNNFAPSTSNGGVDIYIRINDKWIYVNSFGEFLN